MADTSSTAGTGLSFADRLSRPEASSTDQATTSWADEVNSPMAEKEVAGAAQMDGATEPFGGSQLQEPDYTVEVKLSDMQADPNNPLFSVKSFDDLGLDENILKGIFAMNFRKPSKVQERALPLLMANPPQNLIGQSQSGTGKTAAFTLNILSRLDLSTEQAATTPQALVLAPSRELARQIEGVITVMGSFMPNLIVKPAVPVEVSMRDQVDYKGSVIVGTPGTVVDMVRRRKLDPRGIKVLVLDEADNMLEQGGLGDQCSRVKSLMPKTVQVVLFSATFPDNVVNYAQNFAPNANQLTLRHEELTVEGIKQIYLDCDSIQAKYDALVKFYGLMTTRETAKQIEQRMTAEGHKVASLTGAYEGTERDLLIDAFRSGRAKVLITTNVLARGIDVQSVSFVCNYDVPDKMERGKMVADPQTYLHRIGRTGRFGRVGVAVTFVSSPDDWQKLMEIQKYFQAPITRVDASDWDDLEEQVGKIVKSSRAGANFQG
ncbi:putative atp-dependent rna helicase dbp5 [Phaeomoniella chlamydospora]|uniref:RNA helicase n=1 Tax=Phaeomoniella chlamydospora TaxID=158046 RepID=A0A0G2EQM8_PHACM|nr:putative atp-dependent rna helicase dbp5 [Phaeomoniella chlamydospora]